MPQQNKIYLYELKYAMLFYPHIVTNNSTFHAGQHGEEEEGIFGVALAKTLQKKEEERLPPSVTWRR